jgi:hypothetical protein
MNGLDHAVPDPHTGPIASALVDSTGWGLASVYGAILSIQEMGVFVVFCDGDANFKDCIIKLADRKRTEEQQVLPPRPGVLLGPKVAFLAGLPGIGIERAQDILDWSLDNVFASLYVCWGAQAGLYHHYGVPKYQLSKKMFGVFSHQVIYKNVKLMRGFDDVFYAPHSRHTEIRREDIDKVPDLEVLAESEEAGIYLVISRNGHQVFVPGHAEYDPLTLHAEYDRDVKKGLQIAIPKNYYPNDDPTKPPVVRWRGHANLLYSNWLNYYVYQETPFDLRQIPFGSQNGQ